jgi:type IV pilus assembly protein PilX
MIATRKNAVIHPDLNGSDAALATKQIFLLTATRQRGATLIVSMVILAVITLLGLSSMRNSTLDLKMAASARDKVIASQAAESALLAVENLLAAKDYSIANFMPSCNGDDCFNQDCLGGRCFSGDLEASIVRDDCSLANIAASGLPNAGKKVVRQHWKEENLWNLSANPESATYPGFIKVLTNARIDEHGAMTPSYVRYMVEFLCFVPKDDKVVLDKDVSRNTGIPLFQVTVRADGDAGRATVMLQSVFKGAE